MNKLFKSTFFKIISIFLMISFSLFIALVCYVREITMLFDGLIQTSIMAIILMIIITIIGYRINTLKTYIWGLVPLSTSLIFYGFMLLNRSIIIQEKFITFEAGAYRLIDDEHGAVFIKSPKIIENWLWFQAPVNYCLPVDSIDLNIKTGLLGLRFPSKEFNLSENNKNCWRGFDSDYMEYDREILLIIATGLREKRCFDEALQVLNTINKDSLNIEYYQEKGQIFMFREEYETAHDNFLKAVNLEFKSINNLNSKVKNNPIEYPYVVQGNTIEDFDREMEELDEREYNSEIYLKYLHCKKMLLKESLIN